MSSMMRDDLIQRLKDLDEEASLLFGEAERLHMVIVGGGALILMELLPRSTHDIDVLDSSRKLHSLMESYDINTRVQTYINNFPYNYEDRLVPLHDIQGKIIDFYTASLEDIVIAKLYSYRGVDHEDITDPNVLRSIDWVHLHELAVAEDETKRSALNDLIGHEADHLPRLYKTICGFTFSCGYDGDLPSYQGSGCAESPPSGAAAAVCSGQRAGEGSDDGSKEYCSC